MLEILYQDNHLLAVVKPAGLATQPSPTSDASLEKLCKEWIKKETGKPGNVYLHAIHRLDKPVSGIVLFAKSSKALSRLNEAMRMKHMQKTYLALVEGNLPQSEGNLEHYLLHGDHYAHVVPETALGAKSARLRYVVTASKEINKKVYSLVEIKLETGRYHQIRAQMSAIGYPIIGDSKYGSHVSYKEGAIALSHAHFSFPHPTTGEIISLSTSLGDCFLE